MDREQGLSSLPTEDELAARRADDAADANLLRQRQLRNEADAQGLGAPGAGERSANPLDVQAAREKLKNLPDQPAEHDAAA